MHVGNRTETFVGYPRRHGWLASGGVRTSRTFGPAPAIVGHRGSPLRQLENTAGSFAAAAAEGAGWVELDARLTADGQVVVHHDPVLPDGRPLVGLSLAECRDAGVSSLADVLAGLPAGLGVDVEIKNLPGEPDHDEAMAVVALTADVLAGAAGDRALLVTSFNPMVLIAADEQGLPHATGLLTYATELRLAAATAVELGCAVVCPHDTTEGLDAAGVAAAHEAGLDVLVWTVDDPARLRVLAEIGVDALCTNDPAGAIRALGG